MQNHQEVKLRILKTAVKLFHKQGYNNTGINQIIKEAHVAKASLYYHFKTKEDLCIAYLEQRHIAWNDSLYNFIKKRNDKVPAAFDFLIENNNTFDFRGCSFLNILSEVSLDKKELFQQLQEHKKGLLLFFETELQDSELAYTIYSLFENAIIESQLFRSQEPVLRLKKIAISLLH